jgi:hypothetical protein
LRARWRDAAFRLRAIVSLAFPIAGATFHSISALHHHRDGGCVSNANGRPGGDANRFPSPTDRLAHAASTE